MKALDARGCRKMEHAEVARIVHEEFGAGGWWSQMVTVGYERLRGTRVKHEMTKGFQIAVSATIAAPVAKCYGAWTKDAVRAKWLGPAIFEQRTSRANKTLRYVWGKSLTPLEVYFWVKGPSKTQVVVQQGRLAGAADGERCKKYWRQRLDALRDLLEGA